MLHTIVFESSSAIGWTLHHLHDYVNNYILYGLQRSGFKGFPAPVHEGSTGALVQSSLFSYHLFSRLKVAICYTLINFQLFSL